MAKRKTKIVATIGPACSAEKPLRRVIEAGVDVCRLNFSHGTHDSHSAVLERIRRISYARSTYAVEETPNPTALTSIPRLIEHLRDSRSAFVDREYGKYLKDSEFVV